MNCSVCQSVLRPVEKVTNCILQHPQCFPSYQEQPRADISLFQCYGCGHYAIEPLPLEEIYEDYEMDASKRQILPRRQSWRIKSLTWLPLPRTPLPFWKSDAGMGTPCGWRARSLLPALA